jgi:hypothetical protein
MKKISLFSKHPDSLWGQPILLSNAYWDSLTGIKPSKLVSSAEVKNEWSYTSTSLTFVA